MGVGLCLQEGFGPVVPFFSFNYSNYNDVRAVDDLQENSILLSDDYRGIMDLVEEGLFFILDICLRQIMLVT